MIIVIAPQEGGIAHVACSIYRRWRDDGVDCALIQVDEAGNIVTAGSSPLRKRTSQCPTARPAAWSSIYAAWRGRRFIRTASSLHVELGRTARGAFWFTLACAIFARRVPLVLVLHDLPWVVKHPAATLVRLGPGWRDRIGYRLLCPLLDRPLIAMLRKHTRAVGVLSCSAASAAVSGGWTPVTVVNHGADEPTEPRLAPSCASTVVLAGYLARGKGLDVVARAWAMLDPSIRLVIVGGHGDDQYVQSVKKLFEEAGRFPEWTGFVPDSEFIRHIATAGIIIIPYLESNPASGILARAMAEGRAIVASKTPATECRILNDVNGLLVAPGDAKLLAEAVAKLVNSPETRDVYGAAARATVAHHTWAAHADQLKQIHGAL